MRNGHNDCYDLCSCFLYFFQSLRSLIYCRCLLHATIESLASFDDVKREHARTYIGIRLIHAVLHSMGALGVFFLIGHRAGRSWAGFSGLAVVGVSMVPFSFP